MRNYEHFKQEDFVQDLYFREWVLEKSEASDTFWESWCASHPGKRELIEQARSMVIGLACEPDREDSAEIEQAIGKIMRRLKRPEHVPFYRRWSGWAAAVAALIVVCGGVALWHRQLPPENLAAEIHNRDHITWEENEALVARHITLTDGSTVELAPESRLGIEEGFGVRHRTVFLEGEAFFDVERQPEMPFLVHADNVITKVLGTSFNVKAYEQDENVSVSVRSGKVTVQTRGNIREQAAGELVLTPNQQAVISKKDDKMIKTLVKAPIVIRQPEQYSQFRFNDTPISEVFKTLENAYGITISYDPAVFQKCNLTARLTNEDLFEKLGLICETIQAGYKVTDGQLLIQGYGCD